MRKAKDEDNPKWTSDMFRKARPAKKMFAELDLPKPKGRGAQKTPVKVLTTIRLDRDVIAHFKAKGRGWQTRMNDTLRKTLPPQRKRQA